MSLPVPSPATTVTVFPALQQLPDPRDNRGKRHDLAFVLCGVLLAIIAGGPRVSAKHRFLRHRFAWVREFTQATREQCISRAQFPRPRPASRGPLFPVLPTEAELRTQLTQLLATIWTKRWLKQPSRKWKSPWPRTPIRGNQTSVFRLITAYHKQRVHYP